MRRLFRILVWITVICFSLILGFAVGQAALPPADQERVELAIEQTVSAWPTPTPMPTYTPIVVSAPPVVVTATRHLVTSTPVPSPTTTSASRAATQIPATPTLESLNYVVANTGGDGVYLRKTIEGGERLSAWPDGTELVRIGRSVTAEGRIWEYVRAPDGNEGYVPQVYLVSAQELARMATREALPTATVRTTQAQSVETCTAATRQYIANMESALSEMAEPAVAIQLLFQALQDDPMLFFDETWQALVSTQMTRVHATVMHATRTKPNDPAAARIFALYEKTSRYLAVAATSVNFALGNADESEWETAVADLNDAVHVLEEAKQLEVQICG